MLESIKIQNFRCLRHVDVQLEPFTVLIGANDSGKTTLLRALLTLGRTAMAGSRWRQQFADKIWNRDPRLEANWSISGTHANESYSYNLSVNGLGLISGERLFVDDSVRLRLNSSIAEKPPMEATRYYVTGRGSGGFTADHGRTGLDCMSDPYTDGLKASIRAAGIHRLDPSRLSIASHPVRQPESLAPDGSNLAGFLDGIFTGPNADRRTGLEKDLRRFLPLVRSTVLAPEDSHHNNRVFIGALKRLQFEVATGDGEHQVFDANQVSDGAAIVTAYLALAAEQTSGLLLIEEPENGLHPLLLKKVVALLRSLTVARASRPARQVVVTTHSPLLLNYVHQKEVRIVTRDREHGTTVRPLSDAETVQDALTDFELGEAWQFMGEEGLATGVTDSEATGGDEDSE
jgi:predicted ATPase